MNNKTGGANSSGKIFSILFLAWFVLSVIMLVVTAKKGVTWLMIAVFGQYFLVFGLIACVKFIQEKKLLRNSMIWIFVVVGFLALFYGIDARDEIVETSRFIMLSSACITGCGIIAIAGPFLDIFLRKRRCSVSVYARVADIKTTLATRHSNSGVKRNTLYCPVYEVNYNGGVRKLCSGHYDAQECMQGQMVELMINPNDPDDFYDVSRMKAIRIADCIFGISYLIIGIALIYVNQ